MTTGALLAAWRTLARPVAREEATEAEERGAARLDVGLLRGPDEEMDPSMIYSMLVHADLTRVPKKVWDDLKEKMYSYFACEVSYRKNRHTSDGVVVPFRVTMRGPEASLAVEVTLDTLCSVCPNIVTPHDVEPARAMDPSVSTLATWRQQYSLHGAREVVFLDLKEAMARRVTKRLDNRKVPTKKRSKILRRGGVLKSPRLAPGAVLATADRPAAEPMAGSARPAAKREESAENVAAEPTARGGAHAGRGEAGGERREHGGEAEGERRERRGGAHGRL